MKWKKAMLIYNQAAGKGNIQNMLEQSLPILSLETEELMVLQSSKAGDALEYCQKYGEQMDAAFILGGDGTVHECINGLASLQNRPVVGILPGGTCNDFSRTLNIPQTIRQAAETMISGQVSLIDAGKAGNNYFLNFWGIGLIAETSANIFEKEKNRFGTISYLLSAIRTVGGNEPFPYKIEFDGEELEGQAVLVLVLNGNYIGTNSLPFSDVYADDGFLNLIIVKESSLSILKELLTLKGALSEVHADNGLLHFQAKEMVIETPEVMDVDMDGEIYAKTPAVITSLPQHFRMISGKSEKIE